MGVITKLGYISGSFLCTEWGYLLGSLEFQILFELLEISDIFSGVNGRCWAQAYVCRKNESTPPPPPLGTKIGKTPTLAPELAPESYTAEFCIIVKVILWSI